MHFVIFFAFWLTLVLSGCITEPERRVHIIDCGSIGGEDTLVVRDGKCVHK